jgi:hypothetical protein
MINKLMTFERKNMKKVYGPTRTEDGYWRIKTNKEINDILKGQNIIGFLVFKLSPCCCNDRLSSGYFPGV